jgi:hypothetical protein
MATIDIFSLEPSVISRDLKGKYIAIYGREKVGKSTFGSRLPRALFCNFEVGTNFLSVRSQNISKWSDFKLVLRQLEMPKAHDFYDTVVIDTAGQAYTLCEEYICAQAGVQKLGDIPYGAGYASCKKEFEAAFRKITMLGYGICFICHSEVKKEAGPNDTVIETVARENPEIQVVKINTDKNEDLTLQYDAYSLPALVFFKRGVEVRRHTGTPTKAQIETLIK